MKLDASAGKLPDRRVGLATGVGGVSVPVTRDGFSYIEGTLTSSTDSQAPFATVDQLRSSVHAIAGADGLVGGSSAINLDTQRAARHDHDLVVPLVLVAVFVILALVLRAQPRRRRWLWWPSDLYRRPDIDLDKLEDDQTPALTT
jgi:MMPL family